jgi:hypothetical protein
MKDARLGQIASSQLVPPAKPADGATSFVMVAINRNAEALHDAANLAKCCARW